MILVVMMMLMVVMVVTEGEEAVFVVINGKWIERRKRECVGKYSGRGIGFEPIDWMELKIQNLECRFNGGRSLRISKRVIPKIRNVNSFLNEFGRRLKIDRFWRNYIIFLWNKAMTLTAWRMTARIRNRKRMKMVIKKRKRMVIIMEIYMMTFWEILMKNKRK